MPKKSFKIKSTGVSKSIRKKKSPKKMSPKTDIFLKSTQKIKTFSISFSDENNQTNINNDVNNNITNTNNSANNKLLFGGLVKIVKPTIDDELKNTSNSKLFSLNDKHNGKMVLFDKQYFDKIKQLSKNTTAEFSIDVDNNIIFTYNGKQMSNSKLKNLLIDREEDITIIQHFFAALFNYNESLSYYDTHSLNDTYKRVFYVLSFPLAICSDSINKENINNLTKTGYTSVIDTRIEQLKKKYEVDEILPLLVVSIDGIETEQIYHNELSKRYKNIVAHIMKKTSNNKNIKLTETYLLHPILIFQLYDLKREIQKQEMLQIKLLELKIEEAKCVQEKEQTKRLELELEKEKEQTKRKQEEEQTKRLQTQEEEQTKRSELELEKERIILEQIKAKNKK